MAFRYDWTPEEILQILEQPLEELRQHAKTVHQTHGAQDVQKCKLLSIKTGACPEDCSYCSQSARYQTPTETEPLMTPEKVFAAAKEAKEEGATRFCMGTAWRDVPTNAQFESVLHLIRGVAEHKMEVCCTFGMATADQLKKMKEAGLTAYNHNIDTSREYYPNIVSTRTFEDRLTTLKEIRKSGVQICSGGIIGLGETRRDRAAMLAELASFNPHPESVPINLLVPVEGTPLEHQPPLPFEEFLRVVATARIVLPASRVRLSAGRNSLTENQQLQCFEVGANSIFIGDKLLTTPNVEKSADAALMAQI